MLSNLENYNNPIDQYLIQKQELKLNNIYIYISEQRLYKQIHLALFGNNWLHNMQIYELNNFNTKIIYIQKNNFTLTANKEIDCFLTNIPVFTESEKGVCLENFNKNKNFNDFL